MSASLQMLPNWCAARNDAMCRDITGLRAPAGAATLAASRCNGRDQPDAHGSNQYPLGQLDPHSQSIVEYVAVSLTRRLMYGDCARPNGNYPCCPFERDRARAP